MGKTVVYKLKEEHKGKIFRRQVPRMGEMEFDTNKVKASEYKNYATCGFDDLFEKEELEIAPREKSQAVNESGKTTSSNAEETENEDAEESESEDEEDLDLDLEKDEEDAEESEETETENEDAEEVEDLEALKVDEIKKRLDALKVEYGKKETKPSLLEKLKKATV